MSSQPSIAAYAKADPRERKGRWHGLLLIAAYVTLVSTIVGIGIYGFDYYLLDAAERPFSPKHAWLKPSGTIGAKLGTLGLAMFVIIFIYSLRKHWAWLAAKGNSRHWLDFHVMLGICAPFVIALHASFKFRGFAGMAFWIMLMVAISGVVGRYLYAQIPRRLNSAEFSKKELEEQHANQIARLATQNLLPQSDITQLLKLPSPRRVDQLPMIGALGYMFLLDLVRPFRIARLRRHALPRWEQILTIGGLLSTRHADLESVIRIAKEEASLAKHILFLSRSEQVFHLWHVVHKPFSYSFAVLAIVHILVVTMMGFF